MGTRLVDRSRYSARILGRMFPHVQRRRRIARAIYPSPKLTCLRLAS